MRMWLLLLTLINITFSQSASANQACPDLHIVCKSDVCTIGNDNSETSFVLPEHLKIGDLRPVVKGEPVLMETSRIFTSLLPVKEDLSKTYLNCRAGSLQIEEFTNKDFASLSGNLVLVILLIFALAFGVSSAVPSISIVVFVSGLITYMGNIEPLATIFVCVFSVFCYWAFTRDKYRDPDSLSNFKSGAISAITTLVIGMVTIESVAKFDQNSENSLIFQFLVICAVTLMVEYAGIFFRKYKLRKFTALTNYPE